MPPSLASACRGMGLALPASSAFGSLCAPRSLSAAPTWYASAHLPLASRIRLSHSQSCLYASSDSRPRPSFAQPGSGSALGLVMSRLPRGGASSTSRLASAHSTSTASLGSVRSHRTAALPTATPTAASSETIEQTLAAPSITSLRRAFQDLRTLLSSRLRRGPSSSSTLPLRRKVISSPGRKMPRVPSNPMIIVFFLLALNTLVILAWQYALYSWRNYRDPRPYVFMARNFLSGDLNLREGRVWTLLTACISHEDFAHFALNMVSLFFTAPPVLSLVGPRVFLQLYFGAGVASSVISMGWHRFVDPWIARGVNSPASKQAGVRPTSAGFSHGASGSVYAIMSTFACLMPNATFLIFFVIPAPAWACMTGVLGWDLYSAWFTPGGRTDSAGHIGGVLAGVAFWRFGLRGMRIN